MEFLDEFLENRKYYEAVIGANVSDNERHDLLVDILARILGVIVEVQPNGSEFNFVPPNTTRGPGSIFRFFPSIA